MSTPTLERILRQPAVQELIPVGDTKFHEDIAPRLTKVQLGPRAVGYTLSSVKRLIERMIAESATAPKIVPPPNNKQTKRRRQHA